MVELSVLVCCFSSDYLKWVWSGCGHKVTPLLKSLQTACHTAECFKVATKFRILYFIMLNKKIRSA